jgi:octaheme c-type cytochrome (tetrathionate reductase family)
MRQFAQLLFLVLLPVTLLGILIYDIQNLPGYNNLEELRETYTNPESRKMDHSGFEELKGPFASAHDITAACLRCHEQRGHELLKSHHFTWEREDYIPGKGVVYYGKRNGLNNFCTGIAGSEPTCNRCHAGYGYSDKDYDFTNPFNIDCLSCHDISGHYEKGTAMAGYPVAGLDYSRIFASLGTPQKANCGSCHFHSAGGNNVKHGDLESALLTSGRDVDIHMGNDGMNMKCVDCHKTENHVMKGRYYGISSTSHNRAECADCHTPFPHKDDLMNEHTLKVDCRTCHIPVYAKVNPTKMSWDWSTATRELDSTGTGISIRSETGEEIYLTDKGTFTWQRMATPDYVWFNGTAGRHLLTDTVTESPVRINRLLGSYRDRTSKIVPVKMHRGFHPYDPVNGRLLQAKLWDAEKGKGALWIDYDWDAALKAGMEYLGLPFSGQYEFIPTEMALPVSHMVSAASDALSCRDCHTRDNGRLAGLTDFYMPGRDRHPWIDGFGKGIILLALLGVFAHAISRIIISRRVQTTGS